MIMTADKIKALRESRNMTQSEIAKAIGITRSSVNAWEMGISIPSTTYIVELALLFGVSADYLLDMPETVSVDASGLTEHQINTVVEIIRCFRECNEKVKASENEN